jgi:2-phosphosulfolactate phosphatase
VLVGSTVNASAVAARAMEIAKAQKCPITLLMAGRNNQPCIEDELAAGEILTRLGAGAHIQGSVPRTSSALEGDFFAGDSGRNLANLGYADDVRFCAQLDRFDVVPVLREGILVPLTGALP